MWLLDSSLAKLGSTERNVCILRNNWQLFDPDGEFVWSIKNLKIKSKLQLDSIMRHAWCALVGEGCNVSQNWYPSKCLRVDCFAAVQL